MDFKRKSPKMEPKPLYFPSNRVSRTDQYHYHLPKGELFVPAWRWFCKRYLEDYQQGSLRALAITGTIQDDWQGVFGCVMDGKPPFDDLDRKAFKGEISSPFEYFLDKLARKGKWRIHYPPLYPDWLLPYNYTQYDYLYDLEQYWENVDNSYYHPWPTRTIGEDSPEVARLKWLGEVARGEIDEVARQAALYVNR